jgi:hypothetical protein
MENIKNITLTFGTSSHYFKSSAQMTFQGDIDIKEAKKKLKETYFELLASEINLTKKFNDMEFDEIKKYISNKLKQNH